eukprot:1272243-Prymnesium_polylepis.1
MAGRVTCRKRSEITSCRMMRSSPSSGIASAMRWMMTNAPSSSSKSSLCVKTYRAPILSVAIGA